MRVAIVGGGIVGLATGYRLLQRFPSTQLLILEKEAGPGRHQTSHNSGVLHSGLYYKPGSSKARLAVRGIREMVEFCIAHDVSHKICGKVVIAAHEAELPRLHSLLERGTANGLKGLRLLQPEEIREIEPHAAGIAAIHVPQEGIVDFAAVASALTGEIRDRGGDLRFSSAVTRLRRSGEWRIETTNGDFQADFLINCAGLHCDRISRLAGNQNNVRIVPFRGEYYKLKPESQHLVRNLIYPVPDPSFPFLGVHFTRQIGGNVEAGPNAVLAFAREGYQYSDISVRDLVETLSFKGFWRFLVRYPKMCWREFSGSLSKALFCRSLQRLVPEIQVGDLADGGTGVRAQALSATGELLQDFYFVEQAQALHVLNAPSPGATASLAIADEVITMAQGAL